jgi:hypothetical protein
VQQSRVPERIEALLTKRDPDLSEPVEASGLDENIPF